MIAGMNSLSRRADMFVDPENDADLLRERIDGKVGQ
jgi:hypothetical protein